MLVGGVFAITGSIGNAKMVLRVEQGDIIDKSILVKNVNDVPINVELFVSGDLANYVDLDEEKISLEAGEETNVFFSIEAVKAGTSETKINLKFSPIDGGNGVGLSSTIIIIAQENPDFDDSFIDDTTIGDDNTNTDPAGITGATTNPTGITGATIASFEKPNLGVVLSVLAVVLIVAIVVILVIHNKRLKNQRGKEEVKTKPKKTVKKNA